MNSTSPEPRWRRLPEERPAQILDAALEVFGEQGLAGARLEEIAQRAGISKGTIYLYFEGKDDLFRAVVQRTVVEEVERIARVKRTGSAAVRLRHLLADFWSYVRTPAVQAVYRLVIGELHRFPELAAFYSSQVSGRVTDALTRILETGIAGGEFRAQDPRASARMLVALFVTHAMWCERSELFRQMAGKSDAEVFEELVDFYMQAIRPDLSGEGEEGES